MPSADEPLVVATAVSRRFAAPGGDVVALDGVDVSIAHGSLTVVTGASGSGKSTLLAVLAAVDRPDAGRVVVAADDLTGMSRRQRRAWRRRRLGFVHAVPADNLTDRADALGNVVWAASLRGVALDERAARELLDDLGLAHVAAPGGDGHRRAELSGGEQQRLAFACAVAGDPVLVVADEPTASLDARSADDVVAVVRQLADRGTTIVVASHDPRVVAAADQVVRLEHGRRVA